MLNTIGALYRRKYDFGKFEMSEDEIFSKIEKSFTEVFGRKVKFKRDLQKNDIPNWDSMQHIVFLVELENQFGIRFDGASASNMLSIQDLHNEINKRLVNPND